jgi:hypothetical protein
LFFEGFRVRAIAGTAGTTVDYVIDGMSSIVAASRLPMYHAVSRRRRPMPGWFRRSLTFGNCAILLFLIVQALDGMLTYIGLVTFGPAVEGNPLLSWMMATLGAAPALAGAKFAASAFGIVLHLTSVHRTVAVLAVLYISAAILPWVELLFWHAAR